MVMDSKTLTNWSIAAGLVGVILYVIAFIMLWQGGQNLIAERIDHKDLYFAGSGFLYIAIWLKLGAIYHKGQ